LSLKEIITRTMMINYHLNDTLEIFYKRFKIKHFISKLRIKFLLQIKLMSK